MSQPEGLPRVVRHGFLNLIRRPAKHFAAILKVKLARQFTVRSRNVDHPVRNLVAAIPDRPMPPPRQKVD